MKSDRLRGTFERLRKTPVTLFSIKTDDYSGMQEKMELCRITADVQPLSGELAREQYGMEIKCGKRIFCDSCGYVAEGNYAEINGMMYHIVYVADWSMGMEAVLKYDNLS